MRAEASAMATTNGVRSIGVVVALGAVAMSFAALLFACAVVRVRASSWPPPGEAALPIDASWPIAATAAALLASAAIEWARRRPTRRAPALLLTAGAGAAFLGVQVNAWSRLVAGGVLPSSGIVASVAYALTAFHAAHAFVALALLTPALVTGGLGKRRATALGPLASFWHFVTVAWLVIALVVFVA